MIIPDFNTTFKDYTKNSKAFALVIKEIKKEDSYINATEEVKKSYEMMAQTVFEAFVIYQCIVPTQVRQIMRGGDLKSLVNDLHSKEVKSFMSKKETYKLSDNYGRFIISLTGLVLSRPQGNKFFNEELQAKSSDEAKKVPTKKAKIK